MRYNVRQVDSLAAEYVLGTLRAAARRRFEKLITERGDVRIAVWRWERHLNGLIAGVKPQRPPRRIWVNIQRRIRPSRPKKTGADYWWRRYGMALPAAIAFAWLGVFLLSAPGTDRVAVFSDQNATALWIISAYLDNRVLRTESVQAKTSARDRSYELWVLPAEGPPQSLGILRTAPGSSEVPISVQLAKTLELAGSLAISLEPAGGSPSGLPTGPIVYETPLVTI